MLLYNDIAFTRMREALGLTCDKDLLQLLGSFGIEISRQNFSTWKRYGALSVGNLLSICNAVHFPVAYFFRLEGTDCNYEYKIYDADKWRDVEFIPKGLISSLREGTTYEQRKAGFGIGRKYSAFLNDDTETLLKMRVSKLLEIVNKAKVYLGDIVIDDNETIPAGKGIAPVSIHSAERIIENSQNRILLLEQEREKEKQYYAQLTDENRMLQDTIEELRGTIHRLEEEATKKNVLVSKMRMELVELLKKKHDQEKDNKLLQKKLDKKKK